MARAKQKIVSLFLEPRKKGIAPYKQLDLQKFENLEQPHQRIYGRPQRNKQTGLKLSNSFVDKKYNLNSQPLQKQSNHKYPYSAVGNIYVKRYNNHKPLLPPETSIGTGFLIGPNLVLTCAHNINIDFFPTIFKKDNKKGFKARKVYVPQKYQKLDPTKKLSEQPADSYDFALIKLQTKIMLNGIPQQINLQAYFGSLGYDFDWQAYSKYSYPNSQIKQLQLWCIPIRQNGPSTSRSKGNSFIEKNHLIYAMETEKGVSGTPVVIKENGNDYVIGIHVKEWQQQSRAALKLTPEIFKLLQNEFTRFQYSYTYDDSYVNQNFQQLELYIEKVQQIQENINKFHWILVVRQVLPIGPTLCKILQQFKFQNLVALNLNNNKIGDKGCQLLKDIQWKNLQKIRLQWNQISTMGCKHLSKSRWQKLQVLDLSYNNINENWINPEDVKNFPSLQKLVLHGTKIDIRQIQIMERNNKWFILI